MSAPRPRPVTSRSYHSPAKPGGNVSYRPRTRLSFESSSGSTESLVSILDHLSCDSREIRGDGRDRDEDDTPSPSTLSSRYRNRNNSNSAAVNRGQRSSEAFVTPPLSRKSTSSKSTRSKSSGTRSTTSSTEGNGAAVLSPWEKWLIRKEREKREDMEKKLALKEAEVNERIEEEKEKLRRLEKASRVRQKWLLDKATEQEKQERRQTRIEQRKKAEEKRKKEEIAEKADKKYQEWQEMKKKEAADKKTEERKAAKEKAEREAAKKEENTIAFEKWKKESRLRHVQLEEGGRLAGPFAATLSPAPSYCNPVPWKPIHIPTQVEKRPKTGKQSAGRKVNRRPTRPANCWEIRL